MKQENLLRTERFPTPWCGGCGLNTIMIQTSMLLKKLNLDKSNTAMVSGIGCTARATGFFDLDGVNGLHGRAVPIAEGIKKANSELKVIVFSGDGDLTGIGGNHLLHCARRNTNLTVMCSVNETYAMTGGQLSPMSKKGMKTLTSPYGSEFEPINIQGLISSNPKYFYARTSIAFPRHMIDCIEKALKHEGFAFIEIHNPCYTNVGIKQGFSSFSDMLKEMKTRFKIVESNKILKNNELGVVFV